MSGVRWEPVDVWLIDGRPARFVWRERLYTVLSILERPPAHQDAHGPGGNEQPRGGSPDARAPADTERPRGGSPDARAPADTEEERDREGGPITWRCWKVTASAGRNVPANIYRLCEDQATGRWQLTRNGR